MSILEQFCYFLQSCLERYVPYQDLRASLFGDVGLFPRSFNIGPKKINNYYVMFLFSGKADHKQTYIVVLSDRFNSRVFPSNTDICSAFNARSASCFLLYLTNPYPIDSFLAGFSGSFLVAIVTWWTTPHLPKYWKHKVTLSHHHLLTTLDYTWLI